MCLDHQVLDELRAMMGAKFTMVLQLYLKDTAARLTEIGHALGDVPDIDRVVLMAHSIKSSSAQIGAAALAGVARDLEAKALEPRPKAELLSLLERMRDIFMKTENGLQSLVEI